MKPIPEAVKPSMGGVKEARTLRKKCDTLPPMRGGNAAAWAWVACWTVGRMETRETLRALRAARRMEGTLAERWGVK